MRNLQIGDVIAVENGAFEPVYSFGQFEPDGQADFLEIKTDRSTLQVSRQHLIFVVNRSGPTAVPSSSVQAGDHLVFGGDSIAVVESIKAVFVTDGLFAPFTPSGKLVVNGGILVSSYIAFGGSALMIGGVEFSYQWLAHSFEFPHRVACYYLGRCPVESYNDSGLSSWVAVPLELGLWLLDLEPCTTKNVILLTFLAVASVFSLVEFLLLHAVLFLAGVVLGVWKLKDSGTKSAQ